MKSTSRFWLPLVALVVGLSALAAPDPCAIGGTTPLASVLALRPHEFFDEAPADDLSEVPGEFHPKERAGRKIFIRKEVAGSLLDLLRAARENGFVLSVRSGFRSYREQGRAWREGLEKFGTPFAAAFEVAPPCHSEHATGRAVDFGTDSIHHRLVDNPVYAWFRREAPRFGWVPSFAPGDPRVSADPHHSGLMAEPWHYHHVSLESELHAESVEKRK